MNFSTLFRSVLAKVVEERIVQSVQQSKTLKQLSAADSRVAERFWIAKEWGSAFLQELRRLFLSQTSRPRGP